jgi:hypothetical protein
LNSTKLGAFATAALTLIYIALFANLGVIGVTSGEPVGVAIGIMILVFPLLGVWLMIQEFRFGMAIEKLAKKIQAEGAWPVFEFELRPSGRPTRASADFVFLEQQKNTQAHPEDFHSWFSLGLAYDAAGDRRRARAAMRTALKLAKTSL